jgi:hypothetical protein
MMEMSDVLAEVGVDVRLVRRKLSVVILKPDGKGGLCGGPVNHSRLLSLETRMFEHEEKDRDIEKITYTVRITCHCVAPCTCQTISDLCLQWNLSVG